MSHGMSEKCKKNVTFYLNGPFLVFVAEIKPISLKNENFYSNKFHIPFAGKTKLNSKNLFFCSHSIFCSLKEESWLITFKKKIKKVLGLNHRAG